jgi:tetratricopeptide (TPR) repeat protein
MRSIIKQDIPKLAPQKDWGGIPSDPLELFFLSNINGTNSVGAISSICAKPLDESIKLISSLIKKNVVIIKGVNPTKEKPIVSTTPPSNLLINDKFLKSLDEIDCQPLNQTVDLTKERKIEILRVFNSINQLNPFQIFSVSTDISDKDIKRAYQKLTLRFHPDRYYGKSIGDFSSMINSIFKLISDSYELLSTQESRDNLLTIYGDSFEETPPQKPADTPLEPTREQSHERKDNRRSRIKKRLMKLTRETPLIVETVEETSKPINKETLDKRKKHHRKKFLSLGVKERIAKAKAHLVQGKKCQSENNCSGAASHFNMALSLDPKNPEIIKLQRVTEIESNKKMSDQYINRAKMEEDLNNFEKAARLFALATEVTKDVNILISAARCFSKIEDHHKAKEFALRAVEQCGDSPKGELCLATIYFNAAMFNRAKTIIVKVLNENPDNKEAKSLEKQIQRKI